MKVLVCFLCSSFRLEFESHCARLNAQREYEQNQLEQLKKKVKKMEESIDKEAKTMTEQMKVIM